MSSGFQRNDSAKEAALKKLKLIAVLISFFPWIRAGLNTQDGRVGFERADKPMIGIKIYAHGGSLPDLFADWEGFGVNTVFASPALASQDPFTELARERGIAVFLILPIFYNPEELEKDPGLYALTERGERAKDDWVEFICPTRPDYLNRRLAVIKTWIRDLDPDGISLDFIRYFVFWEMVYPERTLESIEDSCYDGSCLERFQRETGIKLPENISGAVDKARWIISEHRREWRDWKCGVISGVVRSIVEMARTVKPEIIVNIHTIPWRQDDFGGAIRAIAGQDLTILGGLTDMISPMCYWHMLKRDPPWIHEVVEDAYSQSKGRVIPSIQVGNAYRAEKLSAKEFSNALKEALRPPSAGVVLWSWEALVREPEKKAAVAALLKSRRRPNSLAPYDKHDK